MELLFCIKHEEMVVSTFEFTDAEAQKAEE